MKNIKVLFLFIFFLSIISCSKNEEGITNEKPQADFSYSDEMGYFVLIDYSMDADGDNLSYSWSAIPATVEIVNPVSPTAFLYLPSEQTQASITLVVSDDYSSNTITKNIVLPEYTKARRYGLGKNLTEEHSNNCDYDWYYDQNNTGYYSYENCGPTSVTMAIKWVNPDFEKTAEDARNTYKPTGGWWKTSDITNYLDIYSVNNKTIRLSDMSPVKSQIDDGNIVILCLDHYYIRNEEKGKWHVDKFYISSGIGSGHFIVVKGYKVVDGETFYETYDPANGGRTYSDGTFKGLDRYYRSEDLNQAVQNWWKYAIIVSKEEFNSSLKGVDINEIVHQYGK